MKKLCLLVFICTVHFTVVAQMTFLPDTNFRNKLLNQGYGSCMNGDSIDGSCPMVQTAGMLTINYGNIYDIAFHVMSRTTHGFVQFDNPQAVQSAIKKEDRREMPGGYKLGNEPFNFRFARCR